ncbi:MAG: toprim domain-containing protein [Desulfovibrio sp.]|nr:toprim domain-containing protein [Desulfovibrio sp.]
MANFADFGIELVSGARGETRTRCPQCSPGRHKSYEKCLAVNVDAGVWYCHHCGWAGGLTQGQAERARQAFATPRFQGKSIADAQILAWFRRRGISTATLEAFHIAQATAWMPGPGNGGHVGCILFPYFLQGKVVNVKYRTLDKRFRQEKNARKCLYNHDMALAAAKEASDKATLIITEGEMDCLALYEVGFRCVVSVPDGAPAPEARAFSSKFAFLEGMEALFESCGRVLLAVDSDAPGQRLRDELCRRIGMERCFKVFWPQGCKDANDVLIQRGPEALIRCLDEAKPFPVDGVRSVHDLWDALFDLHSRPEQAGVDIGWPNAAQVFNVEPGQLTVVTGIPSHGKSTFIDALRVNLFRLHGWASAAFSPENWPAQAHLALLVEMYAGMNFRLMRPEEVHDQASALARGFFFIQPERDADMLSVEGILQRARVLVYREGIKVLVIDPWNEVAHDMSAFQREDQYISAQLAKIRRFARVNGVHVFVIAHPRQLEKNKDGSYPAPTAYDIAGGAMWRNKADNILCVYRPDMRSGETVVLVQKIRFRRNGQAGAALRFVFHVDTSTYHPRPS